MIASWSYALIRDTGAILVDMNPDRSMATNLRQAVESEGDQLADLHLWRLGPGHIGAIPQSAFPTARFKPKQAAQQAKTKGVNFGV